jgi:hypothetical protein
MVELHKEFSEKSKKTLANHGRSAMMFFVPLYDEFGDWATPKDSSAGHFLRLWIVTNSLCWMR